MAHAWLVDDMRAVRLGEGIERAPVSEGKNPVPNSKKAGVCGDRAARAYRPGTTSRIRAPSPKNVTPLCESVMRDAGHDWSNLGYMEADIVLQNVNSGKAAILRVTHPGGGSSYAISYRPQKIIESYEGGEKPAVALFGHYHKFDAGSIRNVWFGQTGCAQDQTPFMRKKSIEAHVGGLVIELEQDPETGAIVGFRPDMRRFFNRRHYVAKGLANNRWSGHGKPQMIPRRVGMI